LNTLNANIDWYRSENHALPDPSMNIGFNQKTDQKLIEKTSMQVQQLDYSKGTLNPLLKQTIKRIISIDSQYRETKDRLSTEFTFNLSEPLRDVVALRLYSVQIPFTWYTIGNNYGANYIYLKGNSPGIDNGNFDYQIVIPPGNYTNQTLVKEIKSQIPNLIKGHTDISFGLTDITYNETACKSNFTIDIKNLYNESDYQLIFPDEPTLNKYPLAADPNTTSNPDDQYRYNTTHATSTLSAYLGFDNQSYKINTIVSYANTMDTANYQSAIYTLNSTNNFFTISREYADGTGTNENIVIALNLTNYTPNQIVNEINTIFSNNTKLKGSTITRKHVTDISKNYIYNYPDDSYYYEMTIFFNKGNDPYANVTGLKTYIAFPTENAIWTGRSSLFKFKTKKEYTNVIDAESESNQTDYPITSSPYIVLKCIKTGFNTTNYYEPTMGSHDTPSTSSNDFIIEISNSSNANGYNFTSYINEISTKLKNLNNSTKNYDNSKFANDISYNSFSNKVFFNFEMNITFTEKSYTITFGEIFTDLGFSTTSNIDLTNEINATNTNFTAYRVNSNELLATIYPKSLTRNYNDPSWQIIYYGESITITSVEDIKSFIKGEFNKFVLSDSQSPIQLDITSISNTVDNETITNIDLNFTITRSLSQNDYDVYLYDASGSTQYSWSKNLFFDTSYHLFSNYVPITSNSSVISNSQIAGYTFYMDKDTQFTLSAITPGAYSSGGENNIVIKIPKPVSGNLYTRREIFNIINAQFNENPLTQGSIIESFPAEGSNPTNKQYVKMTIKINKMFTASDYKIVFYDQDSFVKCFSGTKSVRNVTWDSTLGWVLGFRSYTEYEFNNQIQYPTNSYSNVFNVVNLTGDTTMTTNIYDYFLIILDDYTQSHLNDGLVTIIPKDMSIPLPSYAKTKSCTTGEITVTDSTGSRPLTDKQLYAANAILNQAKAIKKSYSMGPYIQDVFGLIPLKLGIPAGQTYVEFGGTLQNQERVYFGPVNISRMTIKLINDRGEPVDLNGANWSFSFICEQLYNPNERSS